MEASDFSLHYERTAALNTSLETAFDYLDDFQKLAAHMEQSSGMMMGSAMTISTDEHRGRAVGAKVRMTGKVLGITLGLEEVVTERQPPFRKVWETVSTNLLVIGQYRLGFVLSPTGAGSMLRVSIDYELPTTGLSRWLGRWLGNRYARWCVDRMIDDATAHLSTDATQSRGLVGRA